MKEFCSYGYSGVNVKKDVAKRFREFSRQVSTSHTLTLEAMMNFFEWNDLSPNDDLGIKNNRTNKRINAVIAILKNIEKHQTLPTRSMLDTLFQEMSKVETEEEEEFDFGTPESFTKEDELKHYRERYEQMQEQAGKLGSLIAELSGKMTYVKGTFGQGHFKLNMDKDEFDKLKNELQDVYHHQRTEG